METGEKYGSRAWMESQYASSKSDPWGLDWRPSQKYRYLRMYEALKLVLADKPRPVSIVDVGCATGAFTAMLRGLNRDAEGGSVTGCDISEAAVARAAARFPGISFERAALEECAGRHADSAEVVTCMEVLYYLPAEKRGEAIRQLKSMLKPGGYLLVSSMIASAPYFSFEALKSLVAEELNIVDTGKLHLKHLAGFEKLLMKAGGSAAGVWKLGNGTVERFNRYSERFNIAQSHAYVIAQRD